MAHQNQAIFENWSSKTSKVRAMYMYIHLCSHAYFEYELFAIEYITQIERNIYFKFKFKFISMVNRDQIHVGWHVRVHIYMVYTAV